MRLRFLCIYSLAMNYAEDRRDRRARHVHIEATSSDSSLITDWNDAFELLRGKKYSAGHELLGKTLRDGGWCRHAVHHYAMSWIHDPENSRRAGDYAQMAELAGYPEIGVLALLHYRAGGSLVESGAFDESFQTGNPVGFMRENPPLGHCGCGLPQCGNHMCSMPMTGIEPMTEILHKYSQSISSQIREVPTANALLAMIAKNERLAKNTNTLKAGDSTEPMEDESVPSVLRFWQNDQPTFRSLDPVLQILLVKLLYVTIPSLAAEAIIQLQFERPRELAALYKSHNAYYVLIRAVLLGNRIKPHRRLTLPYYHVPVWDLLFDKDRRLDLNRTEDMQEKAKQSHIDSWISLGRLISACNQPGAPLRDQLPKTWWWTRADHAKPLFIVGDSHVLSMAWQHIRLPCNSLRLAVPIVVTGIKAWHTRKNTRFFTNYNLHTALRRLPSSCQTIVFTAGEIDCREGIGEQNLEGYSQNCQTHVKNTVAQYVDALTTLSQEYKLQILVLPVAPHARRSEKNGKAMGRSARRQAMQEWNQELQLLLPKGEVYLLDYQSQIRDPKSEEYVLDPAFNADYTHMNSAFLPCLESALHKCGCNLSLM